MDDKYKQLFEDRLVPREKIHTLGVELREINVMVGTVNTCETCPLVWGVWLDNELFYLHNLAVLSEDVPREEGLKYWQDIVNNILFTSPIELDEFIHAIMVTQIKEITIVKKEDGLLLTLTTMHDRVGSTFIHWNYQAETTDNIWETIFELPEG